MVAMRRKGVGRMPGGGREEPITTCHDTEWGVFTIMLKNAPSGSHQSSSSSSIIHHGSGIIQSTRWEGGKKYKRGGKGGKGRRSQGGVKAMAEGVVSEKQVKKGLFRTEKGPGLPWPYQAIITW